MDCISPETLQNFCRACLKELKQRQRFKIQTFDLEIQHWLGEGSAQNPLGNDAYPNSVCCSCRNKLNEFLKFRIMYMKTRKRILAIMGIKERENNFQGAGEITIKAEQEENFLDEPLISSCISNAYKIEKQTNNEETDSLCSIKYGHATGEERITDDQEKCNINYEHIPFESGESHTESESDNPNECEYNSKIDTKDEHIPIAANKLMSRMKGRRKKYIYSFRCDQCKYRCVSQQTLDIHMRTHYGLKPYQCCKCEESFEKSSLMLKHLYDKHGEKELTIFCEYDECGERFSSNRSYKDHYRQSHIPQQIKENRDKVTSKSPNKHICEECGKIFLKLQAFKQHQYTHGPKEQYPYQCDECDKAFINQGTFNEHKLRHAGIKKFECPQCGVKKTTKKELKSHMNSHTKERKYPCPNCPMVFYRSSNRRIHVDVVHQGIRRFACRYCDQTFGKGDNLKNHELLHTGEKPHACTECGKRFVQRVSLRSHMKTHIK